MILFGTCEKLCQWAFVLHPLTKIFPIFELCHRAMQFAEMFPDLEIVKPLASQWSWTHFTLLLSVPSDAVRLTISHKFT